MLRYSHLLIVAALALPAAATAQTLGASATATLDSAQLYDLAHRLNGKNRIRLVTEDTRFEVRGLTLTPQALAYDRGPDGSGPGAIAWSRIAQVQVRKSVALQGGLIGAAILGLAGLGLGASVECTDAWLSYCIRGGDLALLTAASAAAGFFVGALVAAPFGRWSTVYRSETAKPRPRLTLVPSTDLTTFAVGLRFDVSGGP